MSDKRNLARLKELVVDLACEVDVVLLILSKSQHSALEKVGKGEDLSIQPVRPQEGLQG